MTTAKTRERSSLNPKEQQGMDRAKQLAAQAAQPQGSVAATDIDYSADAGAGLEGADRESYAIPFLAVLQPLSPQVAEETIKGAKAGMLINTVTNDLFERVVVIPCAFQRRWVRWAPRDTGGGYKGEFNAAEIEELRRTGKVKELDGRLFFPLEDGTVNDKKCDRLSDTRNHYVMMMASEKSELCAPAVLALTSTGIKRSKNLLSRIESIKLRRPSDGSLYTAPSFSHMYEVTTVKESNDKGTWWSPEIVPVGPVTRRELYEMAKAFHAQVTKGQVTVAHDTAQAPDSGAATGEPGKF